MKESSLMEKNTEEGNISTMTIRAIMREAGEQTKWKGKATYNTKATFIKAISDKTTKTVLAINSSQTVINIMANTV
jgi:hypothetical protein